MPCRMPRSRGTTEAVATLVGRLLLAVSGETHTSKSLASQLGISSCQVHRYLKQLAVAGWQFERLGTPTHGDYRLVLVEPKINDLPY